MPLIGRAGAKLGSRPMRAFGVDSEGKIGRDPKKTPHDLGRKICVESWEKGGMLSTEDQRISRPIIRREECNDDLESRQKKMEKNLTRKSG